MKRIVLFSLIVCLLAAVLSSCAEQPPRSRVLVVKNDTSDREISIISVNVDLDGSRMVAYNVLPDGEPLQPQREATVFIPPNAASVKISVRSNLIGDTATTTVVEYLRGQSIVGDYRDEIRARFHYNTETSLHEIDFSGSGYQPQEMD